MATPGYFETMGIPRLAGRDFGHEAANSPRVGIVNRAFAEHFFGRENPIGRRVTGGGVTYEIIGVVENIKSRTLGEDTRYVLFRSLAQSTGSDPSFLGYQLVVHFRAMRPVSPPPYAVGSTISIRPWPFTTPKRYKNISGRRSFYLASQARSSASLALWISAGRDRPLRRHQLFGQPPHTRNWYSHSSRSSAQRGPSTHSSPGHDTHRHRGGDWTTRCLRAGGNIEQLPLWCSSPRHHDLHHRAAISGRGCLRGLLGSGTSRNQSRSAECVAIRIVRDQEAFSPRVRSL